jgi:hypothetical protein
MRRWLVLLLMLVPLVAHAGTQDIREYVLFNGSNTSAAVDTVEQESRWFPVYGASRVVIRIWSANTSAWTAADSTFADSITTWKVLLSDSTGNILTSLGGQTIPGARDSLMLDMLVAADNPDTTRIGLGCKPVPFQRAIAAAKTGSGILSTIYPIGAEFIAGSLANATPDASGVFMKQYMKIRWQPLRRMTEGGRLSTTGKRTVGIRGLRMRAYVIYGNK